MKASHKALLSFVLLLSHTAIGADRSFDITSAKSAFVDEKVLYVSAGYPKNHEGLQSQLNSLWEKAGSNVRTDKYKQPWRVVSIADLENIYSNSIDRLYISIYNDEVFSHKATKAFIWRWGCDGSLIPVLELGLHKFSKEPWGVDAFGVTSLPEKLKIMPVDKALIPKEFYGPLRYPDGWELWVNGIKSFSYIDRNEDHNGAPQNLLFDHKPGSKRIIMEKSATDMRC